MVDFDVPDEDYIITYWKDILETPMDRNKGADPDGSRVDVDTNPVYLAATVRGTARRHNVRDISPNKSIFIPINPVAVPEPEATPNHTVQDCKQNAKDDEDSAEEVTLTIDGAQYSMNDLRRCRQTGPFDVVIPPNAIAGLPPGPCKAVADGYYVLLKPLPPGQHEINYKAKVRRPHNENAPWGQDVTYRFKVK